VCFFEKFKNFPEDRLSICSALKQLKQASWQTCLLNGSLSSGLMIKWSFRKWAQGVRRQSLQRATRTMR